MLMRMPAVRSAVCSDVMKNKDSLCCKAVITIVTTCLNFVIVLDLTVMSLRHLGYYNYYNN